MSQRTLMRLLGAAAVLAVVWLAVALFGGRSGGAAAPAGELASFFDGLTPTSVGSVDVVSPTDTLRLQRATDHWTVNGLRADSSLVAGLWTAIEEAAVTELAARNPANHDRMGVGADSAIRVSFQVGQDTRTLLVGKSGAAWGSAFVRLPAQDAVYVLEGNLRPNLVRRLDDWRDKRIAAADTSAIEQLHVWRTEDQYVLQRADSAWVLEGNGSADAFAVRNVLSELADLRASGFLAESDSLAMTPAALRVTALASAGDTLAVVTLGSGDGDRWARTRGDETLYRVPSWRVDRLAPSRESLLGGS